MYHGVTGRIKKCQVWDLGICNFNMFPRSFWCMLKFEGLESKGKKMQFYLQTRLHRKSEVLNSCKRSTFSSHKAVFGRNHAVRVLLKKI